MAEQIPFSVVENVLSSLGSSVVEKLGSMLGVKNELKNLEETLGTLNAVLLDAEEQLEKSHAVKDWVKRLKRVVYDVDDLLDDFATNRLGRGGPARQVSRFFSSSNQVAFRFQMSGRVEDIKEALDELKKDIFMLSVIPHNTIRPRAYNIGRETHSSPSSTSSLVGQRNTEKENIINLLVSPDNEHTFIVAIVGIGGLGKTTLAQLVYDDEEVKKHFEPRIWVCVSDDDFGEGFGEIALLKKIIKSESSSQSLSLDDLKNMLHKKIYQKKYFLVLDDVWNNQKENWEKVRALLKVGAKGSKVLVTTRNTEVSFMGDKPVPVKLKGLNEADSWKLFSDITFGGQENTVSPEIINVGRQIVNMCNGVPLIINTVGGILMQFKSDLSKWLSIRKNENLLSLAYGNDNVLRVLKLSYDNLPTHLKQCFTYCASFPKDYKIEKKSLVQLWIAQGYIQSPNGNEPLEDIGDRYFKELLSRSLLDEVEKGDFDDILTCKMHDLIHDLAQSIMGSEVLVLRSGMGNISREARHISLFGEVIPVMEAMMEKQATMLKPIRTFLNLYPDYLGASTILNSFLPSVMCLRALSLNDMNLEKVPKCLGKLIHLRYLDLSRNGFKILPNSITRLKNLETLKLQHCGKLEIFPKGMKELINLRHLENDNCCRWTHMPNGIGELALLQSLPLFVIGNDIGGSRNHEVGSLSELKSLNQLRGLLCIQNLQNVRDIAELVSKGKILEEKEYLQSLRLEWEQGNQYRGGDGDKSVMEGLQPNRQLKKLSIQGYGAKEFPSWMMNDELASRLPNLVKIEMSFCSECSILPPFSQLPSLKSLKLYAMRNVVELKKSSSATPLFPSLELLELRRLPELTELWRMDSPPQQGSSLARLSEFYIHECYSLSSLHLPPSLSKLVITNCPNLASLELPSSSSLSELVIKHCWNLASLELPSSSSLSILVIEECSNLASLKLPSSSSLSTLVINDCENLITLEVHSSSSLSKLVINGCWNLASLELPSSSSLSELLIKCCQNLASLELPSTSSLSILVMENCRKLSSLKLPSSYSLSKLVINDCVNLESLELPSSSSLSKLVINDCVNLESLELPSSSSLSKLVINGCNNLASLELPSSSPLSKLVIKGCLMLASLELPSSSSLSELEIHNCSNLASLELPSSSSLPELEINNRNNLASFKMAPLPSLATLSLFGVGYNVIKQIKFVHAPLLKCLSIRGIDDMTSLPKEVLQHFSGLETLEIEGCYQLESMELPSFLSLSQLIINCCPLLASFTEAPLPSLSTLSLFSVGYDLIKQIKFVYAPWLKCLSIVGITDMISLPKEVLQHFSGLETLEIDDCYQLESMELPSFPSLSQLKIHGCSLLAYFTEAPLPSLSTLSLNTVGYDVIRQIKFVYAPWLKCLSIGRIDDMISLQKEVLQHFSGLKTLQINECSQLESTELPSFPSLSQLKINNCHNLASFKVASLPSLGTLYLFPVKYDVIQQIKFIHSPLLKCLTIGGIDDMISLPKEVLQLFSGLVTLRINECLALQSLQLLSFHHLSKLSIENCGNLTSFNVASSLTHLQELRLRRVRPEVLHKLMLISAFSSLKLLYIWEIHGEISVPEEPLQCVSTLETLYILDCSGLETLLQWMSSLSSLRALSLFDCTELKSLPEQLRSLKRLETLYLSRNFEVTSEELDKIYGLPDVHIRKDDLADRELTWSSTFQELEEIRSPELPSLPEDMFPLNFHTERKDAEKKRED